MNLSIRAARVWRIARRSPRRALHDWLSVLANEHQLFALVLAIFTSWLGLQTASLPKVVEEANAWGNALQAFIYVALGWAIICLVRAPFMVARDERLKGVWRGNNFAYHQPQPVFTRQLFASGLTNIETVTFPDAEPESFVRYSIEFEPSVKERISATLSCGAPAQLPDPEETVVQWYNGGVRLNARCEAFLSVRMKPATVPVICRVYCHSFSIGKDEFIEMDVRK